MKTLSTLITTIALMAVVGFSTSHAVFHDEDERSSNKEIIVLLHGLGRSTTSMWWLAARLEEAGYHVQRVGYHSLTQTPDEILREVSQQINRCCLHHPRRIHFVGHSLGGLMVRAYLQKYRIDNLGRVVLLGTPNKGSEVADYFIDSWMMKFLGPTAKLLGTDEHSFPRSLRAPYYPVGIIAGENESNWNDSVIPGKDDGLVSVESAKLNGMTDFMVIRTSHSMMRYNREVAEQTIEFIQHGEFREKD